MSLDINRLTFEPLPNSAKACTPLSNIGIHDGDLYFFEVGSRDQRGQSAVFD